MMPNWSKEVKTWIDATISPDNAILLAVSGGADSMGMLALMDAMYRHQERQFHVVYIDHGLRLTSTQDWQLVASASEALGFPVTRLAVDVSAHVHQFSHSVEQGARELRYAGLQATANLHGCQWIMTGHSADDNAETILMKMLNKSPWYEWTGIPRRRGNILRPLLPIRRRDVRSWVTERGVPFLEDETNDDQRFARNALRKRLEQCPVFLSDERIANLIGESRQLACHLHHMRQLSPLLTRGQLASPQSDIIGLEIERILQYFNKLAFIPVEAAWSDLLGDSAARLPSALRRQISQFVYGNASQSALTLPGSVLLERRDRALWLSRASLEPVSIELKPESAISLSNRATVTLAAASDMKIDSGWRLRNWQPGDRVKLPNRPRKKVSDLLCERKLDPLTRRRTLVLTHQECLVCVLEPKSAEYCFQLADGSAWRVTYNLDV